MPRRYTWKRDRRDERDAAFAYAPASGLVIPASADLHWALPPEAAPYDQKSLGSCTGNGNARVAAYAHWKATGQWLNLSRLMVYFLERTIEGTVSSDAGAEIRDGVKALSKWGACVEPLWPYVISKFKLKPPAKAYADAVARLIKSYHRVSGIDNIRSCIAEGFPVVFGFDCPNSFEGAATARTGIIAMPKKNEKSPGGHCMVFDAYDDTSADGMLSGPNSWGTSWGDKGRFHMPYGYVEKRIVSDCWTVRK